MHPHLTDQPSTGAPTGQTLAQFPQEMQVSASISYLFSPSLIAFTGQFAAQAPQEMQSSVILYAMFFSPPKYIRGLLPLHSITRPYQLQAGFIHFSVKKRLVSQQILRCGLLQKLQVLFHLGWLFLLFGL